jgi:hypothetical protein
MPTRSETTMVREAMTLSPGRQLEADRLEQLAQPVATRMPSRMPTRLPSTPSTRPSPEHGPQDLAARGPEGPQEANSRARWATVIEKVLKMMKAPTNREIRRRRAAPC